MSRQQPTAFIFVTRLPVAALIVIAALMICRTAALSEPRHGLSTFGELKYPADFKHFDYVNPDAPRGGRISLIGDGARRTFDSLHGYILKGEPAQRLDLLFDSLMARALDEPDSVYGLIAHSADVAADKLSATFYLRPEARFADGSPLTSADVAFSIMVLKEKGHPVYALSLRGVEKAEAVDAHTVRFTFSGGNVRDLPLIIAQMPVFSKAYYALRPFDESTLVPPLGSGPYEIASFKQGTFVVFKRRKDYWARDLPVMRGLYNFDEVRYEYFRDRTAELEALKAGVYDFREEFTSKTWATEYDVPQVRDGRIKRETLPDGRPSGAQGWFINLRRAKFADPRVRKALNYAFDFEWSNKQLFYNLYKRTESYFENTDLKAFGKPSPEELALLEPYRSLLPPEVFGEVYTPPVTDGSGRNRESLRKAYDLLTEAGWIVKDGRRVNERGEPLVVEFIIDEPSFERVTAPYARNLRQIGVEVVQRRVDSAQYQYRKKTFDYDLYVARFVLPPTPGLEMKNFWGAEAVDAQGSNNLAGINHPVVEALTDQILNAQNRNDLRIAARALDRVLRAGHYWVPHWYKNFHNIAYWDKFSKPKIKPAYSRAVIETWWFDPEKAQLLAQRD